MPKPGYRKYVDETRGRSEKGTGKAQPIKDSDLDNEAPSPSDSKPKSVKSKPKK